MDSTLKYSSLIAIVVKLLNLNLTIIERSDDEVERIVRALFGIIISAGTRFKIKCHINIIFTVNNTCKMINL